MVALEGLVELDGGGDFGLIEWLRRDLPESGALNFAIEGGIGLQKFGALGLGMQVGVQEFLDFFRQAVLVVPRITVKQGAGSRKDNNRGYSTGS